MKMVKGLNLKFQEYTTVLRMFSNPFFQIYNKKF